MIEWHPPRGGFRAKQGKGITPMKRLHKGLALCAATLALLNPGTLSAQNATPDWKQQTGLANFEKGGGKVVYNATLPPGKGAEYDPKSNTIYLSVSEDAITQSVRNQGIVAHEVRHATQPYTKEWGGRMICELDALQAQIEYLNSINARPDYPTALDWYIAVYINPKDPPTLLEAGRIKAVTDEWNKYIQRNQNGGGQGAGGGGAQGGGGGGQAPAAGGGGQNQPGGQPTLPGGGGEKPALPGGGGKPGGGGGKPGGNTPQKAPQLKKLLI